MGGIGPEILRARTRHSRKGAQARIFDYALDFVLVDMQSPLRTPGLARFGAGALAVRDRDHGGPRGAGRGARWVHDVLAERSITLPDAWQLLLLTQPRVLGMAFNPVSFWMVVDPLDQLRLVIAEVSNTFGDRHAYVLSHADLAPIGPQDWLGAQKLMHVSPFQPIAGEYRFRFQYNARRIGILIDLTYGAGQGLNATLSGRRVPLTRHSAAAFILRTPLAALRVLALIHWQAIKLWVRRAPFFHRPSPPKTEVS